MTSSYRWQDARNAVTWLEGREACSEIVRLLARLPLLEVAILQQVLGLRGPASLYRSLTRLEAAGLVGTIRPPVYPTQSPHLLYLTDLGVATLAEAHQLDPHHLARRLHLRGVDLLALLPRLMDLLATYELLGALATAQPGQPELLVWERPWRRSFRRPLGTTSVSASVPAHAVLDWNGQSRSYLLFPDRGTVPLRLNRATLDHLLQLRRTRGDLPALVIATTSRERTRAWDRLLDEVAKARRETPLVALVVRWSHLQPDVSRLSSERSHETTPEAHPIQLPPLRLRRPESRLPAIVGDALTAPAEPESSCHIGQLALHVTPTDHVLLELVGLHPFLDPRQLAGVLGWEVALVRRRMNRLMNLGLMRRLDEHEIGADAGELIELTSSGLELTAAYLGLSLAVGVRELGLTGGGPGQPHGPRRKLLHNPAHTRETDEIFVRFYRLARKQAGMGSDDAMEEWQNAAACSRRYLRPDGYGVYRRHGVSYGFFLEFDRGTMNARDYFKKFRAYYHYGVSGRFVRDYQGYPTILFVASSNSGEERVARVARAAAVGRPAQLPLLLTCRWRIEESSTLDGALGPIWRDPYEPFNDRRYWISGGCKAPCGSRRATQQLQARDKSADRRSP